MTISLSGLATLLLGIWAILAGLAQLGVLSAPSVFMGVLLLIAGILFVLSVLRIVVTRAE